MGKRYIAYEIQNKQPLLITNLDTSKPGEITTLQFYTAGDGHFKFEGEDE